MTEFIDTSHECKTMMVKLSKEALKKSGKVVTDILKQAIPVRTGGLKKSIKAWAKVDYKTGQPYLEVGYLNRTQMKKRGVKYFVNPSWFEFGTKPHGIEISEGKKVLTDGNNNFGSLVAHPGMSNKNFLRNTVMNNINQIQDAQKETLKGLTNLMIEQGATIDIGEDEEID